MVSLIGRFTCLGIISATPWRSITHDKIEACFPPLCPRSSIEDGHCQLVSRHRNVYKSFETLRDALADLNAKDAILDGEIVCLDANGCSQFKELLYRRGRAVFFAFDLVWLDGVDLRQTPLIERKRN